METHAAELLQPSQYRVVPWKNGLGVTTEILSHADEAQPDRSALPWSWRVSIASVPEPAAFSHFAGVERHILCVQGAGMRLSINGQWNHVPTHGRALTFAGEAQCVGEPLGADVHDFNLMVVRSRWLGDLNSLASGQHVAVEPRATLVIHALHTLDAPAVWQCRGETGRLPPGWTAVLRPSLTSPGTKSVLQVESGSLIAAQVQPGPLDQ